MVSFYTRIPCILSYITFACEFFRDDYVVQQKILFKHCDPAGIVFYPRYFEMINDLIEMFFFDVLDMPFEALHDTGGVPAVEIKTQFHAPSRHGDHLQIMVKPLRMGRSSLDLEVQAVCDSQLRFTSWLTLVHVNKQGKPVSWSESIRCIVLQITNTVNEQENENES